jgi:hypothetical protein
MKGEYRAASHRCWIASGSTTGRSVRVSGSEFGLELAFPFDDGGFGDAGLATDAGKAEFAEVAKFVPVVVVVHMLESSIPLRIWRRDLIFSRFFLSPSRRELQAVDLQGGPPEEK